MGFSSALQGKGAHEALLVRQEAELRLLETMKRCLAQKAKCDKDYALALASVAQQGLKIDKADDLQGSIITKSWRTFMEELEQTSRQLKLNSENLESLCSDKLSQLHQEKRKARKQYQEEHSKIATQFSHLAEDVTRKKTEYQKHLEYYKLLRTRFEEHYIKCGRGGRKLDDVRDKYQKACRKLHLAHNEYVLLINEATEVEKDFRTILLPGLLEHQQTLQEGFILTWKNILLDVAQLGDLTSDKFVEIQKRLVASIQNVNPAEEYREFTEKHKTQPTAPITFQFDESLMDDTPKLQPNQLTVDNLTIEWLKQKQLELEGSVKEYQEKQNKMCIENGNGAGNGTPTQNGINGCGKDINKNSKELNAMRCQERQMTKLVDIIKSALNEVGCEELPSGCDDISVEQTFIETNGNSEQPESSHTSSYFLQKGVEMMSLIRAPFRRKSGPPNTNSETPPNRTPRSKRASSATGTNSLGSSSVNSLNDVAALDGFLRDASPTGPGDMANNIYVDIDTNSLSVDTNNRNPKMVGSSITSTASNGDEQLTGNFAEESSSFEQCFNATDHEINDSKNNLLHVESPEMLSSIDVHLDKIDRINRTLDGKLSVKEVDTSPDTPAPPVPAFEKSLERKSFSEKMRNRIVGKKDELRDLPVGDAENFSLRKKLRSKFSKAGDENRVNDENDKLLSPKQKAKEKRKKGNKKQKKKKFKPPTGGQLVDSTGDEEGKTTTSKKNKFKHLIYSDISDVDQLSEPDATDETKKKTKIFSTSIISTIREIKSAKIRDASQETPIIDEIDARKLPEIKFAFASKIPGQGHEEPTENDEESLICLSDEPLMEVVEPVTTVAPQVYIQVTDLDEDPELATTNGSKKEKKASKLMKNFATFKQHLTKKFAATNATTSSSSLVCKHCSKPVRSSAADGSSVGVGQRDDGIDDGAITGFCFCDINDLLSIMDEDLTSIKNQNYCEADFITLSTNRPIYEEEWFHGVLPREEVVRLLRNDGDFLVRETTRNDESQTVLSVCWNGHKHFIVQTTAEGHYRFEGPAFPSIQELILHQYQSELPVTSRSGAILKKPVLRERWELSNDDVMLLDKIGRGNFGDVYKARLKPSKREVAVKTCRMTLPDEQKRKFLQEGRILKQYDHPNIVKLIGICVQKQPIMIVMELVPGGSLLTFLRKNTATLSQRQMMAMCRDAAGGMRYLESKNCIHRDLAARNCLIGNENIVKISDFGMSREEEEYIVSDGMKQIPIKWTAPEALNFGKYTTLCDVWSYGILVWEIFSKGGTPYSGMSNSRARERIDEGYRMPAPDNTPIEMYNIMKRCWSYESESRPHFDEIAADVERILASMKD